MHPYTVIVPVYNEEDLLRDSVEKLMAYLTSLDTAYEIVIVSNGSTDTSEQIGATLAQEYAVVKFFSLPERGVGRAFKKGIAEARYEHIIFLDADLSSDLVFIQEANRLLNTHVLVLGSKIKGLQNRGLLRKVGSLTFYLSVVMVMGMKYVDYAPGAKAYQKNFLLRYLKYIDNYTSFVLNLAFIASEKKEPVVEIPIRCSDTRKSRFNLFWEALSKYRGLVSLKMRQVVGKL